MRLPRWFRRWRWARREGRKTMWVRIGNLTPAQCEAVETLLQQWVMLGAIGGSRWTSFYADGDGNFRPRILVNGRRPRFSAHLDKDEVWKGDELRIDFDAIAWRTPDAI